MRALYFAEHGDDSKLHYGSFSDPEPGPGQVTIAIRRAALNHLDLFVLHGLPGLPPSLPHVGGADGAGTIVALGAGVEGWREGDEVVANPGLWCGRCEFCAGGEESMCVRYGILGEHAQGTFAEYLVVPAQSLARRPGHLSWEEAAAFPLVFLTAWRMLVTRGGLKSGESVLIHGIGGGLAQAALTIASHLGARTFVTSSSAEKLERASAMGATHTILSQSDVAKEIRALTEKRGVDVVIESTGAATWLTSLKCAAKGGRIVTCGATTGPNPAEEIRLIFWNQLSILGSTMGSQRDWQQMVDAVNRLRLRPVVDSVYSIEKGREAYRRLAEGSQFGKVVLDVTEAGQH